MILKKLVILAAVFFVAFVIGYGIDAALRTDLDPVQPIKFSHKIHAGTNEIPCQFCHIYAERSRVSGVPNVQRCMGCHKIIKTESPEIKKLTAYWDKREPIPWTKVHNLPDYVYFPHKRHIRAGRKCADCHGDIASMDRVRRVSSLQMGWCLQCHKKYDVKNGQACWTCHI